jgi:hypothetical protein
MTVDLVRRVGWGATAALAVAVAIAFPLVLSAQSVPSRPRNLQGAVQGSTVTLSWSAGSGSVTPIGYVLEVGSTSGASNLLVMGVASRGLVAPGVPNGRYYVRVRAANAAGTSSPSNEISLLVGCIAPPAAPTGLSNQVSGSTVSLTWNATSGATGYVLEAGTAPGAANVGAAPVASNGMVVPGVPTGAYYVRVRAVNSCGSSAATTDSLVSVTGAAAPPPTPTPTPTPTPMPPPVPGTIFGSVDPVILGTCSAATHDAWSVDGGDGWRYRTWHPQVDPSGCVYAHEHGDNPAMVGNAEIAASPVRFGYIGRRHPSATEPNGHDEPHEGFKVFIANRGEVNDEGRVNRVFSRSVFHMGTGGPRRFTMQHHSAEIRLIHPEFGLKAFTQLMMDTGGTGVVCDPRSPGPIKDVMSLQSPCRLGSGYEIWSTSQAVRSGGREIYRSFATPAVFDPITVINPSNVGELVYIWDSRMNAVKEFNDDWSGFRGCQRESYAQPGYWYNSGGPTTYYTDPMGNQVASSSPFALAQVISASASIGSPATTDGLGAFKMRRDYCQNAGRLGLKN